ncbi:protein IMPACT-B isoform X1 [Procambarus clarkii]|uniref:protein IMPACT-B isoform X1 n=2 Tax=Procambarus clarkii TaxID=6728 RepID=UPI001E678D27|nr:protein IMPACT-B-like isoform X1 [Procambarus clarkii]
MAEDNSDSQNDEIEALSAIYGLDFHTESVEHKSYSIEIEEGELTSLLQVTMPPDYPRTSPPIYMLSAPWLKGFKRLELCGYLEEIYLENAGESIIYMWVERIRQFMVEHGEVNEQETHDDQIATCLASVNLEDETDDLSPCPEIFSGEIISDRKSHFQPHLAAVKSQTHVRQVLRKLYENKKVANATHNMYAFRFVPEGSSNINQNCEDDGEIHAGSRLLHLLQILDAKDVLVVVTRWYGGIHLGPDRFKHINNAARQILVSCGFVGTRDDKGKKNKKGK